MNTLNLDDSVIKLISYYLPTLEDKYNWAITCKSTFSSLYYNPIKNYKLSIVDDNYPRDAFIRNVQSIKFQSNRSGPDFRSMQAAIHFFRKLKVVDVSCITHNAKQAETVLKIVPENLTLLVKREDKEIFEQNAVCVQKKITVELYDVEMRTNDRLVLIKSLNNSLQKRPREGEEDDEDEEQIEEEEEKDEEVDDLSHGRKRQRTPSPVREIIALELAKVAELKKRLCEAYSNRLEVPHILREVFRVAEQYKLATSICTEPVDIGNCIDEIANNLIHAVVTTKEGNWVFITQVEIYVKDTQVDDVAIVSKFDEHPSRIKVVFEKLAEGRGSWCELRVMYHHYEVLVTGAIHKSHASYDAFLGVSAPANMANDTGMLLFSPVAPAAHVRCPRMLRNYKKQSSFNNWCIKSQRFYNEGFSTVVPLREFSISLAPSYSSICARLINASSNQTGPMSQLLEDLLISMNAIEYWKDLALPPRPPKDVVLARLRAIEQLPTKQQQPSQGKRWLIQAITNPASITDTMLVNLYNRMIYPLVKKENKNKVKAIKAQYRVSL